MPLHVKSAARNEILISVRPRPRAAVVVRGILRTMRKHFMTALIVTKRRRQSEEISEVKVAIK